MAKFHVNGPGLLDAAASFNSLTDKLYTIITRVNNASNQLPSTVAGFQPRLKAKSSEIGRCSEFSNKASVVLKEVYKEYYRAEDSCSAGKRIQGACKNIDGVIIEARDLSKSEAVLWQAYVKNGSNSYNSYEEFQKHVNFEYETWGENAFTNQGGFERFAEYITDDGKVAPLKNYKVTSNFGPRDGKQHRGIDIAATVYGDEIQQIHAFVKGKVVNIVYNGQHDDGYGNYVDIEGPDGTKYRYAHLASINVQKGDYLVSGDILGIEGGTGYGKAKAYGAHLHFEVLEKNENGKYVNVDPRTHYDFPKKNSVGTW